jgi:hypothetical protein
VFHEKALRLFYGVKVEAAPTRPPDSPERSAA